MSVFKFNVLSEADLIRESYGEVRTHSTVLPDGTPIDDGLFCQSIFGPVEDYTCKCGKLKSRIFENAECDVCGMSIVSSRVRSSRTGHINTFIPLINPLFLKLIKKIIVSTDYISDLTELISLKPHLKLVELSDGVPVIGKEERYGIEFHSDPVSQDILGPGTIGLRDYFAMIDI